MWSATIGRGSNVVIDDNNRTHSGRVPGKVISCSHEMAISAWLLKFSDFQRNLCFGSKLPDRAAYFKRKPTS